MASTDDASVVNLERRTRNQYISVDNVLDLKAISRHFKVVNGKYAEAMRNYKRNTGEDHPLLRFIADLFDKRANTGEIGLEDVNQEQLWAGQVSYGGQKMYVDFDTGSADTLVNPAAYSPSKSSTSKNTHHSFRTAYGDGTTAAGTIYTDHFSIGGVSANNVAIGRSTQTFIKGEDPNQGIAGMAFPSIQAFPKENPPFFVSLMQQKKVAQGVFQFTIKAGSGSTLHLGGVDKSKFSGDLVYSGVNPQQGFWATQAKVNGQSINAIMDTGSTIITGPTDQVRRLFSSIPGLSSFTQEGQLFASYDCSKTPSVTFNIAGKDFKLGRDQTRYGTVNGRCVFTVVGQNDLPMNAWIIGDSFFQVASVVFDMDKNRMGFAQQA
ncbi:aspartic-type endopeptidase [Malassezia pachydermatis]